MMVYVVHRETFVPAQTTVFLSKEDKIRSIGGREYLYKANENKTYVCIKRLVANSISGEAPCSIWQETNKDLPTLIKQEEVLQRQEEVYWQNYGTTGLAIWLVGSLVVLIVFLVILILRRY